MSIATTPATLLMFLGLAGCGRAPPEEVAGPGSAADSLFARADGIYVEADFAQALEAYGAVLEPAAAAGDSSLYADALTWMGLAEWRLGDYEAAHRHGEEALDLKLRLGLEEDLSRSYNALGLLAWNEGRLYDADLLFQRAFEAAEAVADTAGLARGYNSFALNYNELGDFQAARANFTAALEAYRVLGDTANEGRVLTNLGALNVDVGDPLAGIAALEEALTLYEIAGDGVGEQNALGQLGTAYAALSQGNQAMDYLDRALAMSRTLGLRQEEASILEQLAELHHSLGASRLALSFFDEAQGINAELGLQLEAGANLRSEAAIHASLGNLDYALQAAVEGLEIHEQIGAPGELLNDHLMLADLMQRLGESAQASAHLEEAKKIAQELDTPAARVAAALATARFAQREDRPQDVLSILSALSLNLSTPGHNGDWEAELLRARAHQALARPDSAAFWGRRAVSSVERVRGNIGSSLLRSSFTEERTGAYTFLVRVLLQLGDEEEAFETADASRGRVFLEQVLARRGEQLGRSEGGRVLARNEELLARMSALRVAVDFLVDTPPEERPVGFEDQLQRLNQDLEDARMDYAAGLIRTQELASRELRLLGAAGASALEVRRSLGPDEALIQYVSAPEQTTIFVLRPDSLWTRTAELTEQRLLSRIRIARDLLADPDGDGEVIEGVLGGLHADLLAPILRSGMLDGVSKLIIVPDGGLTYLPFAALWDSERRSFLVEDFSVSYLPSAAALTAVRGEDVPLVEEMPGGAGFAPFPNELSESVREVESFKVAISGSRIFQGRKATEVKFREALAAGGIVHAATHAIMNARNPMFSRILLAGDASEDSENDGRLEVHELIGQEINSPLVFLSGCDTGSGISWAPGVAGGQDYAALFQAFLYAGASNVVATLWPVQDRSAADFTDRFYVELASHGPAEALAESQRWMLTQTDRRAPYFWAAYGVHGSGFWGDKTKSAGPIPVQ